MSYEEDDEIGIRLRRGRASPAFDHPRGRPVYYDTHSGGRLGVAGGSYERSRSRGRREVSPAPVIIDNRVYNDYELEDDRPRVQLVPIRTRSRSRSRHRDSGYTREDFELERARKELEAYKIQAQREEDEKLYRKEMELKRLRDEKRAEDEKKRAKEEAEKAVREWKIKEAEKKEKEKKEKEEREKEYKKRLEDDLRKSGFDDRQIEAILKKDKAAAESSRPTYTRMARRYLSIETLNAFRIDYTFDQDPEYILIKRAVPEYEQDVWWNHTRDLRERRERGSTVLLIEDKKHHSHEKEYEFVRKTKEKRAKSPSPLITFLAGGKGR